MDKQTRPKWYEEAMMGCPPAKGMMMNDGCMAMEVTEATGDEYPIPPGMLAHAYIPWQCYTAAFSPCEALMKGTLFPELWGAYPVPK
ncbi:spore coat associated protein CotJA [Anaeroselena agilis]|uniref:Spore coat associated protein CotJA n=1 Tax=Anaeroselena agilis TaxID=3063788 RepID=A0ABU3P267_9FIRM|nr:spore coat associated protein CotJA [Selenomonadales bacterium 4137-cl]